MSNIIPPMVSSSPPPMDDNIDDDEDDEFGDFASANLPYDIGGDDDDEEDYVEYGTGLEPLDEDAPVRKKPFSLEDQVAKDSHGRRRFHGAFTGGFSAGFFNTVGSLEGWTPSSFKSSRTDRAGKKVQKPSDFMDDEDVGEFGIAPSVLRATNDYSGEQHKRKRQGTTLSDGPIPGKPVLEDLLRPVRDTVGVKLLRKMGWKPGQGVGPRLSKAEKKRVKQEQTKTRGRVYGCAPPSGIDQSANNDSSDDDDHIANLTFAPDDYEQFLCKVKDNVFGIGYSGLDKRPILSGHINLFEPPSLVMKEKKKKVVISGQGFGVGALEDDDEDIYGQEDMTRYDFSLDEPSSTHSIQKHGTSQSSFHKEIGDILDGFVRGCTISSNKRFFPPPRLPPGFQPIHSVHKTRFMPEPKGNNNATQRRVDTVLDRTAMLKDSTSEDTAKESKQLTAEALKITEKLLPVLAEGGSQFKPFANNPDKQKRYEQYTGLIKIGQKEKLASLQPLDMTEWEKEREKTEFEQAVKLFKPLTGVMSDRFVSAVQPDDTTNPLAPVENLIDENADRKMAVKMKMFGRLTREKCAWQPCSLLCKRFNIAEPNTTHGTVPTTSRKTSRFSVFDYLDASAVNKPKTDETSPSSSSLQTDNVIDFTETPTEMEVENEIQEVVIEDMKGNVEPEESLLTFPDPPEKIDLYKAIFLSSSEESESEEEDIDKEPLPEVIAIDDSIVPKVIPPQKERNTSPPRGVFANLDLDAINVRKKLVQPPPVIAEPQNVQQIEPEKIEEDDGVYGPKLPSRPLDLQSPGNVNTSVVIPSAIEMPQGKWVEKHKKHKSKHHKKEKHKKSSKHKSKKSKRK